MWAAAIEAEEATAVLGIDSEDREDCGVEA